MVLAATIVNRWFVARRGTVLGILTASGSTGQLIFLPMLARAPNDYGWRVAVLLVAAIIAALIPLAAWLLRESPESMGLRAYGATADPASCGSAGGRAGRVARCARRASRARQRTRNFWVLCLSSSCAARRRTG